MKSLKITPKTLLILILVIMPPAFFFILFFRYAVDAPINDDYTAVLDSLNKCLNAESISEKIKVIFAQVNEHRIVYDKLWTIICYKVNGTVNFNFLAFIGNLSLVGIFLVFFAKFRKISQDYLYLVPISVLIFSVGFWENMTFAMATLANNTVYLFSLLSLYFLTRTKGNANKNFAFAILLMIFAVFTQGGGLFLIPASIIILLLKRQFRTAIICAAISILIIAVYFYGYVKPGGPDMMSTFMYYKGRAILFGFSFLGNAFNYFRAFTDDTADSIAFSTIAGLFLFLVFLYTVKTKYYNKNPFVFSVMLLVVIIAGVTAVSRCQMGLEVAGASRYRINGVVFLISVYLWFIETYQPKTRVMAFTVMFSSTIYFCFMSLQQYEYLDIRERQTLTGILNFHSGNSQMLNGDKQYINLYQDILNQSKKENTYFLPSEASLLSYFPYSKSVAETSHTSTNAMSMSVDGVSSLDDSLLIEGWAFLYTAGEKIKGENTGTQKVYIGLKGADQQITYYTTKQMPRYDSNPFFKQNNLDKSGFIARIKKEVLKKGEYQILVKVINDSGMQMQPTDKKVIN